MTKSNLFTVFLPLLLILTPLQSSAADLDITISGVQPGKGELLVALFNSEEGFPTDIADDQIARIIATESETMTLSFENLEDGRWAVVVMQDFNGNGSLDSNFIGIPKEPYGASNNRLPKLSAPNFKDSSFDLTSDGLAIEITLKQP